jgi:hypothetical protein
MPISAARSRKLSPVSGVRIWASARSINRSAVSLPKAGAAARTSGAGRYTDKAFTFAGTFALPERLGGRFSTLIDLNAQMAAGGTKRSARPVKGQGAFEIADADADLIDSLDCDGLGHCELRASVDIGHLI